MKFFDKDKKAPEVDVVDMTELAAAIAALNGEAPPSGKVTVAASITSSLSTQIKEEEAEKEIENAEPGGLMSDGTIYIGRFKDKDGEAKDWFAAADDVQNKEGARILLNFNQAAKYVSDLKIHDHDDWILPPGWNDCDGKPNILCEIFNSKGMDAFKGTFDETIDENFLAAGSGWYWSSSPREIDGYKKIQAFGDGEQSYIHKSAVARARPVRCVAVKEKHNGP